MKEVHVVISPDGTIEAEAMGYKGKGCEKVLDELSKAVAAKGETHKKPEYYQTVNQTVTTRG